MTTKIERGLGRSYYERTATRQNPRSGPVSKSLLWEFNKSPFKWRHGSPMESTKSMDFGVIAHAAALEPEALGNLVSVSPFSDFRTKEAREWKREQVESGRIISSADDLARAKAVATAFIEGYHEQFSAKFETETALFGQIGETEIKGMVDMVPTGLDCLVDLKTTASIGDARAIQRVIVDRGMHWQAALYLDLWNSATGENRTRFLFCFVETESPHETAWVEISENFLALGRAGYMNAVAKWQSCVAANHWPSQNEGLTVIEPPKYLEQ